MEVRNLLAATWAGLLSPTVDAKPNDTLDVAQVVGTVSGDHNVEIVGTIGGGSDFSSDVDWFRFNLDQAGTVQLDALANDDGVNSSVVLTLYGDQIPFYDPNLSLGHRLLGRREGQAGGYAASLGVTLEAGIYYVAVSGAGNRFFHPFLADSGHAGVGGEYGVRISRIGDSSSSAIANVALGPTAGFTSVFAAESVAGNDTAVTANDLGDLTTIARLQAVGAIGDDPFYSYENEDPFGMNPAADMDLFHFTITGDGEFALVAEAIAGRIGSTLDPVLTLFRNNGGVLEQVGINHDTLNSASTTNGQYPLFRDPVLYAGLTAGDYFIAVSSRGPDAESGPDGIFDPQFAHSGLNGYSVGEYVLDLLVYPDSDSPEVVGHVFNVPGVGDVSLSGESSESLSAAPTHFSLQFSEPVNVQQLAYTAVNLMNSETARSVFFRDANGQKYFPRLESYDAETGIARFLMLDSLPNGEVELHVSGAEGLTDLAGHSVVGNDASGDHVLRFTVDGPTHGSSDDIHTWINQVANDSFNQAQDLGVLFPHELQAGVRFVRDAGAAAASVGDSDDFFRFELLQNQNYFFTLTNLGGTPGPAIELLDANGQVVPMSIQGDGTVLLAPLDRGVYILHVGTWSPSSSSNAAYQIEIELGGVSENPTPLTNGAAPAVGIRVNDHGFGAVPQFAGYSQSVLPSSFATPASSVSSNASNATPSGLNNSLATLPMGLPANSSLAAGNRPNDNSQLVRLFGFDGRDRLFSMIDSILSRPKESTDASAVTQAELTDSDLQSLLRLNQTVGDDAVSDSEEAASGSESGVKEETTKKADQPTGEIETSATTAVVPESMKLKTKLPTSTKKDLSTQVPQAKTQALDNQPTVAGLNPLGIVLAASLATTLREQRRREKEKLNQRSPWL